MFNTNLHPKFFQQRLPSYPASKRRTREDVEAQRQLSSTFGGGPEENFNLYSETSFKHTHDYILGNSTQRTVISNEFFSQKNIDEIHKIIRFMVYDQSGMIVSRQTDDDLLIIMMSMYKQYCTFPVAPNANQIKKEIDMLNMYVIRDAVPIIISNAKSHVGYLKDASSIPDPIPRPLAMSNTGTKELRSASDIIIRNHNYTLT